VIDVPTLAFVTWEYPSRAWAVRRNVPRCENTSHLRGERQQALAGEILSRRLTIPTPASQVPARPAPPPHIGDEEDEYAEDRELVEIRKVWSKADALRLQRVLDVAGIPFYIGAEKATGIDAVTSNFAEGVSVRVMQVGTPWAYQAMENYFPKDEPPEPKYEDAADVAIRCPKCRSTDVVFDELVGEKANADDSGGQKFQWTCSSCGKEWEDDGVEK